MAKKINTDSTDTNALVTKSPLDLALKSTTKVTHAEINELQDAVNVEVHDRITRIRDAQRKVYKRITALSKEATEIKEQLYAAWDANIRKSAEEVTDMLLPVANALQDGGFLNGKKFTGLDANEKEAVAKFCEKHMAHRIAAKGGMMCFAQVTVKDCTAESWANAKESHPLINAIVTLHFNPVFANSRNYGVTNEVSLNTSQLTSFESVEVTVGEKVRALGMQLGAVTEKLEKAFSDMDLLKSKEYNASIAAEDALMRFRRKALSLTEHGELFMEQASNFLDQGSSSLSMGDVDALLEGYDD